MKKACLIILFSCLLVKFSIAQLPITHAAVTGATPQIEKRNADIQRFYSAIRDTLAWFSDRGSFNRSVMESLINDARLQALDQKDYQYELVSQLNDGRFQLSNAADSAAADRNFTDAAIRFFSDIAYGNAKPEFKYDGLKYSPSNKNIGGLLAEFYAAKSLSQLPSLLQPRLPEIRPLLAQLARIESASANAMEKEENVNDVAATTSNKRLLRKLYALGIIDSATSLANDMIRNAVKEAQKRFSLLSSGVINNALIDELNVPLSVRIHELKLAINNYRWLSCLSQTGPVIVVNIPAAYMKVYDKDSVVLEMKMVVGKRSTPTPVLCSRVEEVVLYPYWMVPFNIATKELLPSIKRNPQFINDNAFQVVDKSGRVMDPMKIDWKSLSPSNFPYTIRQSTGCDNALGLIKLNFYNPFSVYLHDTPDKGLFNLNKRYFSHGCMRMEKPMELGHLVLKNNAIAIDTLEEKGCIRNQSPICVRADVRMPVTVWYNPVGIDSTGRVIFYDDIYRKFGRPVY